MRIAMGLIGLLGLTRLALPADTPIEPGPRYGIAADLKAFPQQTPREALASVLKAIEGKRLDYLLAHLAEPGFVDDRVKRLYGGRFEAQVEETRTRLNLTAVKLLRRFLREGEWTPQGQEEMVRLKDVKDRALYFRKIDGRWYMEQRSDPPAEK